MLCTLRPDQEVNVCPGLLENRTFKEIHDETYLRGCESVLFDFSLLMTFVAWIHEPQTILNLVSEVKRHSVLFQISRTAADHTEK